MSTLGWLTCSTSRKLLLAKKKSTWFAVQIVGTCQSRNCMIIQTSDFPTNQCSVTIFFPLHILMM